MSEATLFERIGGEATVEKLVHNFYNRVNNDEELAPFFAESSLDHLRAMQKEFFAAALDGPQNYSGMDLSAAHYGRGITPHHFSLFVQHLIETLKDIEVSDADIDEIIPRISLYANHVCGGYGLDG